MATESSLKLVLKESFENQINNLFIGDQNCKALYEILNICNQKEQKRFNIYCTSSAQSQVDTYTEFEKKGYKPIKQDSDTPTLTWSNNYSRTFTEEMSVSISPGKTAYFYIMFV